MTDKQKELLAKYNRIAEDKSQLQQFAQELILGEILEDEIIDTVNESIENGDISVNRKFVFNHAISLLTNDECKNLKIGDSIVNNGIPRVNYIVNYKSSDYLGLLHITDDGHEIVQYMYYGEEWHYLTTTYKFFRTETWTHFPTVTITGLNDGYIKLNAYQWEGDLDQYWNDLYTQLAQVATMFSVEIPEINSVETANQAFEILIPYLNSVGFTTYKQILAMFIFVYSTDHSRQWFGSICDNNFWHDLFNDGDTCITYFSQNHWCSFLDLALITDLDNNTTTLASITLSW